MKTDLQTFLDMLEGAGYQKNEEASEHDELGAKEFMVESFNGDRRVILGMGRTGVDDCYTIFYFRPDGSFKEHDANTD